MGSVTLFHMVLLPMDHGCSLQGRSTLTHDLDTDHVTVHARQHPRADTEPEMTEISTSIGDLMTYSLDDDDAKESIHCQQTSE